jgi:hypothetical protein
MECLHEKLHYHKLFYTYVCSKCNKIISNKVKPAIKNTPLIMDIYASKPLRIKKTFFEKLPSNCNKSRYMVDKSTYESFISKVMEYELFIQYSNYTSKIIEFVESNIVSKHIFGNRLSKIDFYFAVCAIYITDKLGIPILMRDVIRLLVHQYKSGSLVSKTKTYILSHFNSSVKLLFYSGIFSRSNYLVILTKHICDNLLGIKEFANVEYFVNQIYLKLIDFMSTTRKTNKSHKKKQFISLSEYYIYLPVYIYIRYEAITKRKIYTKHGITPMPIDTYMKQFCNTSDRNTFNRHYSILKTYDKSLCP